MADEEYDIDPEIAAAMGFGTFGSQTNKKRKYNQQDAVTDQDQTSKPKSASTGTNSTPIGARLPRAQSLPSRPPALEQEQNQQPAATTSVQQLQWANDRENLNTLAQGVRDANGDIAYYMPSFVEDPWASWREKQA
ncbi:hypothetical protein M501DRAFT_941422 [Patellaria atrata CBS 101060]|uniref:Uncharacterized protein n=1 Tax=Patellaria atrata CBS 101060 TaxID=1346257 RepID=A0A9P4VMV1_9PEZI|nr:hypothetical protein M501DRAFT_941422 [Patellaria atrata CBS 101060]